MKISREQADALKELIKATIAKQAYPGDYGASDDMYRAEGVFDKLFLEPSEEEIV